MIGPSDAPRAPTPLLQCIELRGVSADFLTAFTARIEPRLAHTATQEAVSFLKTRIAKIKKELVEAQEAAAHSRLVGPAGAGTALDEASLLPRAPAASAEFVASFAQSGGLGLVLGEGPGPSVFIEKINPGTQATHHSVLRAGLQVKSVGGEDVRGKTLKEVDAMINAQPGRPLELRFVDEPAKVRHLRLLRRTLQYDSGDLHKRRHAPYLTARDVHKHVIVAATRDHMVRYIELPEVHNGTSASTGRPYTGPAQFFFSYSWDSPWQEVVDALVTHTERVVGAGSDPPYYWIDIFAVNQHTRDSTNSAGEPTCGACESCRINKWDPLCDGCVRTACNECVGCSSVAADMHDWNSHDPANPRGFERVISNTKHTLVLMEPWSMPRPPTRVWCLFEQYTTIDLGGQLDVVLSKQQERSMRESLSDKFSLLKEIVAKVDARDAEATNANDQVQIFRAISNLDGSFDGLNAAMRRPLARWLAVTAAGVAERKRPDRAPLSLQHFRREIGKETSWCCCCPVSTSRMAWVLDRLPWLGSTMRFLSFGAVAVGLFLMALLWNHLIEQNSSKFASIVIAGVPVFVTFCTATILSFQFHAVQWRQQLRETNLFTAGVLAQLSWNTDRYIQAWFALGPFVSFVAVSLPGNVFVNGGAFAAIWALGLAVMLPIVSQVAGAAARWFLVAKAAVVRSIVGDHDKAIEQLLVAHSQTMATCGSHRLRAYAVAPMLARAYWEAGLAGSVAAEELLEVVNAAVDGNCSGCKWWHCINWIERITGGERSGDWLAIRAHMTAATSPDDRGKLLRQLNDAASRGYAPGTSEDKQSAWELALIGLNPPGQDDEEQRFWKLVNTNKRCRVVKAGCGFCFALFGVMLWFAIFVFMVILPCEETRDVPGFRTCDCSEGFAHDFLPECVQTCDCGAERGCSLCCQLVSTECHVDPDIYLNSCGLSGVGEMPERNPWYSGLDCHMATPP